MHLTINLFIDLQVLRSEFISAAGNIEICYEMRKRIKRIPIKELFLI